MNPVAFPIFYIIQERILPKEISLRRIFYFITCNDSSTVQWYIYRIQAQTATIHIGIIIQRRYLYLGIFSCKHHIGYSLR